MSKKKNKDQRVEVQVRIGRAEAVGMPNERSPAFDLLLEQHGAESFVFIPLKALSGKRRPRTMKAPAISKKKAKLPKGNWFDGELRNAGDGETVPGVLAFDVRRRDARKIAEEIGVKQFVWGARGAPVEGHFTKIFDDDETHTWRSARGRALDGLMDILAAARNMSSLPRAVEESQTSMKRFRVLIYTVLGLAFAGALLLTVLAEAQRWITILAKIAFYPSVMPAVAVGVYLRALMKKAEMQNRDFTASEAEANWNLVAPHLLALWALCYCAVVLLTWLQSVPSTSLPFLGQTNNVSTSFIVCVWMLLPIAHSKGVEPLLSSALESGIAAMVSIFTIRLSLYITNLITDTVWNVAAAIMPFDIPEALQELINTVISIGAEVFFLAVLLGYAWSRTRQQFMRL